MFILKFDSAGVIAGDPFPLIETDKRPGDIEVDTARNIYVVGWHISSSGYGGDSYDFFVRKYNSSGNIVWSDIAGTEADPVEALYGIAVRNGSVYVTGGNSSGPWTRKYNPCGRSDDGPPDVQNDPACR